MAQLQKNLPATIAALAVAGVAVWGALDMRDSAQENTTSDDLATQPSTSAASLSTATPTASAAAATASLTPTAAASTTTYRDGTYTATGSYSTPGGTQRIELTVRLQGDVITQATVKNQATDKESSDFQDEFIEAFSARVVGKKISELSLSKTSGSSLTPRGFNAALATIKNQAS